MQMKLYKHQLMSALSLHVFAAGKSEVTDSIKNLQFKQTGERLNVVSTDRYAAAWGQYVLSGDTVHTNTEPFYVYVEDAKMLMTFFKNWPETEFITVDEKGFHMGGDSVFPWSKSPNTYPPIEKLFNKETGPAPTEMGMKISMMAKLDKILMPNSGRKDRDAAWRLRFQSTETNKPGPVECYRPGQRGNVTVLIQPTLLLNN